MNVSPALLTLIRTVVSMALIAAGMAILPYLADISHLSGVMPQWLAFMISTGATLVLHEAEANKGQAAFGAIKRK